ncbi:hypothetical protein VTH06DRAFT_1507 [Thermothelomyces fergusii]
MPPKAVAKAATGVPDAKQPTAQEAYLFYTIIKNMKGKPEIDWAAVAADAGYKTAETAKVRYGQIKRKLGLDNWNNGKAKDAKDEEAAGDGDDVETPVSTRTKKSATTPGTGAGVKKRTPAAKRTPGSRSRKAKSEVMIKMEEDAYQDTVDGEDDDDRDEDGDEHILMNEIPETPTKKKTRSIAGRRANRKNTETTTGSWATDEYANFPVVLPEPVIEREAILVNNNGVWTVSPVPIDVHAQWLARLPAGLQTRFYLQAHSTSTSTSTGATPAPGIAYDNHGNSAAGEGDAGNAGSFILPYAVAPAAGENEQRKEGEGEKARKKRTDEEAHGANNIAAEDQEGLPGLAGMVSMGLGGYVAPDQQHNNGNGANGADGAAAAAAMGGCGGADHGNVVDLQSIPWHPGFFAEQMVSRDEERDRAVLFGGGDGHDQGEDGERDHGGY